MTDQLWRKLLRLSVRSLGLSPQALRRKCHAPDPQRPQLHTRDDADAGTEDGTLSPKARSVTLSLDKV